MSQTFYKKGFLALAVAAALGVSTFVQADVKIGVAGPMTGVVFRRRLHQLTGC